MNWPNHLPKDCPPQDAQDASGEIYRLVNHSPPHSDDFRSWREENVGKALPNGVTECQAGGLSVYRNKMDACRTIRRIPRFKKAQPALGVLAPSLGKILCTPSREGQSHHTWWVPVNIQPWTIFQITSVD
jgi:hypothetical protein